MCVLFKKKIFICKNYFVVFFKIDKYFYIYVFFVISYTGLFSISMQYANGFSKFLFHTYFY